jgi:DNA-directed RNA polymerase omega subunit
MMNEEYLAQAQEVVNNKDILINLASRRASELARGANPLIKVEPHERDNYLDIALQEVAAGKITYDDAPEEEE